MVLSRNRGNLASYLCILGLVCLVGVMTQAVPLPIHIFLLGVAIIGVSLLPLFKWIRSGTNSIPMFELIGASYGLQFGFAVYTQPNLLVIQSKPTDIPWDSIMKAQALSLLGVSAMVLAYGLTQRLFGKVVLARVDLPMTRRQRMNLLVFSVVCWAVGRVLQAGGFTWLGGINRLLALLPLLAFAIMTLALFRRGGEPVLTKEKLTLVAVGLWLTYAGFSTAMLEAAFIPLAIFLIIRTAKVRRISLALLAVAFVVLSVANGIKMGVRAEMQAGARVAGTGAAKLWAQELARTDIRQLWRDVPQENSPAFWRGLLDRFGLLNRFGWVCMNTPERVPFFMGETYKYFLYASIPRVAWPNKPAATDATARLDYAYLLRSETTDADTYAIGIGYIPEAYANFSWIGIALVLALQGVIFALFDRTLNSETSEGGAAIYMIVTVGFLNGIGATSIMLFGNIAQLVLACVVLVFLFSGKLRTWGEKRGRARPPLLIVGPRAPVHAMPGPR